MNSDSNNNLNNDNIQPIQPITNDNNDIENSINSTPVPLQPINVEENKEEVNTQEQTQPSVTSTQPAPATPQITQQAITPVVPTPVQPVTQQQAPVVGVPVQQAPIQPVQAQAVAQAPVQGVSATQPQVQNTMQPNGVMTNETSEQIQSLTTGPVKNDLVSGSVDQAGINFVSTGKPLKKKKNPVIVTAIVVSIVAAVSLLGYFFVYPFIVKTFFNKPKDVFTKGINNITSFTSTFVDDTIHDSGTIDVKLTLDTNIEPLDKFSGYAYGLRFGIDPYSNSVEMGYNVYNVNTKENFSEYYYLKKDSFYKRYSTYRDLLYITDIDDSTFESLFDKVKKNKNQFTKLNNYDAQYLVKKISGALIGSIDDAKLTKEDANITINNNTIKATRNKYVMNSAVIENTKSKIINDLANDENVVKILSKILEIDSSKVSDALNDLLDFEDDATLTIGIITAYNKIDIIGYELSYSDKLNITYYTNNGNFELNFDSKVNILDKDIDKKINVIGIKKDKVTDVTIKVDDEQFAKLSVSSWSDNEKIFDFSIIDQEGKTINGSLKYTKNNTGNDLESVIELKIKNKDLYLNATLEINYDWTKEVAYISTNAAKTVSKSELNQIDSSFLQYLKNTPFYLLYGTISGDIDPSINDYYGDDADNENELDDEWDNDFNDSFGEEIIDIPVE